MKLNKIIYLALSAVTLASCDDVDEMAPDGGVLTAEQIQESVSLVSSRGEASFAGMFSMMGKPYYSINTSKRADDFGFIMMAISQDCEASDYNYPNSGYNWFSVCGELSSRNPDYANPRIRYIMPYSQIGVANDVIKTYQAATDSVGINHLAQAKAIRAFDYLALAPYFQFRYEDSKDLPCVPIVTEETTDFANNPRATVAEVYELILSDLNYAIENLSTYRSDKSKINVNVAYGIRARAYLNMGMFAEAAADAEKAIGNLEPASVSEVSVPSFYNIADHNWIWGIDMTSDMALSGPYATSCSWLSSFSSNSYAAGTGCYASISNMLYDKIPSTDVRKGWWLDENLHSDLLSTCSWGTAIGDEIATLKIADVKEPMYPYANVKFGMMSGIGSEINDNDFPLMRVEEMLLIAAEGYAKSGNEAKAKEILTNFVTNYRDANYTIPTTRSLADEIWFQRRVELWGEGFAMSDIMRLKKPIVRFHDTSASIDAQFRFNVATDDPWLLMRFPTKEVNANVAIVNNTGGIAPVQDQNPALRDGVTD